MIWLKDLRIPPQNSEAFCKMAKKGINERKERKIKMTGDLYNKFGRLKTIGGYHSPDDVVNFKGISFVFGRTSSSYLTSFLSGWNYVYPDPFVRFFLFPFLSLKK